MSVYAGGHVVTAPAWILIFVMYTGDIGTSFTQEFTSLVACEDAAKPLLARAGGFRQVLAYCVPKGPVR